MNNDNANTRPWTAKYRTWLVKTLPELGRRHERNPRLLALAHVALHTGIPEETLVEQIVDASSTVPGVPPLAPAEVRRALATARASQEAGRDSWRHTPAEPKPTAAERAFVPSLVAAGRGFTADSLKDASPHLSGSIRIPRETCENRDGAFATQIAAMAANESNPSRFDLMDLFWVGGDKAHGAFKSVFDMIHKPWSCCLPDGRLPNFVSCNPFTGQPASKSDGSGTTLRGDACVTQPKLLLLEWDGLSHEEQYALVGALLERNYFKVVSVVDSGNKSLHTLVAVEGEYDDFRKRVRRLCCSADDPRHRADRAVMHPSALTRLAGAVRPETQRMQELLYASFGR